MMGDMLKKMASWVEKMKSKLSKSTWSSSKIRSRGCLGLKDVEFSAFSLLSSAGVGG